MTKDEILDAAGKFRSIADSLTKIIDQITQNANDPKACVGLALLGSGTISVIQAAFNEFALELMEKE